jgi:hypothetical protein
MAKINVEKTLQHLREKWKHPCSMCGQTNWSVQDTAFELREFHGGGMVVGGPVIPVVPVVCGNCGNTVLVNALIAGAIEREEGGKNA